MGTAKNHLAPRMTQVRRSDLCSGRLEGLFCTGVAVESSQQTATGALCIAKALRSRGVQHVFGMPGGVLLPLVEAIRAEGIALVLVRHEASAGFMADASYQLTGAPGVALSTLGPGMTNLVSGAAGALLERSRVLLLTGQVATELLGLYTHQILDQVALLRPVVKYGVQLRPGEVGNQLVTALAQLDEGRAGPVHLDLPADALAAPASNQVLSSMVPGSPVIPSVSHSDVLLAKTSLEASKRPVLAVGCGDLSDHASQAVVQLANKMGIPVLTTYRAKGMVPEGLGWSAGAFGALAHKLYMGHRVALYPRLSIPVFHFGSENKGE